MEEIRKKEEEDIAAIRSTKYIREPPKSPQKVKKIRNSFINISPNNWRPNRLPRPIWGIIISYSDSTTLFRLESLCKMLYLLINPLCNCTDTTGFAPCQSLWRTFSTEIPADISCIHIKKGIFRESTTAVLIKHLEEVKRLSCNRNLHSWEIHPSNPNVIRCRCCTKGAKRNEYCSGNCEVHGKMCLNENLRFTICRNHTCIVCQVPQIERSVRVISQIFSECSQFTILPKVKLTFRNKS